MPTSVQLAQGTPDRQPESIGPLLARLRLRRGHSQLRLAEQLCAASGVPTVTRHEVSRWERERRVPGPFWLGWLAAVLEVPLDALLAAPRPARHVTQPRPAEASGGATGPRVPLAGATGAAQAFGGAMGALGSWRGPAASVGG